MSKNQGIRSKNVVRKPVRTGKASQHAHPGGVAQQGQHVGNKAMNREGTSYRGEPLFAGAAYNSGVPLGNEKALDVGKGGVGTGRTLYGKSGTNQVHGPTNPGQAMKPSKPLWEGWEK